MLRCLRVWTRVLSLRWAGVLGLLSRASPREGAAPSAGHLARTSSRPGPPSRSPKAWLRPQRRLICFFSKGWRQGSMGRTLWILRQEKACNCTCHPTTATASAAAAWLAGLRRGCGFSICVWDKRAFLCFDSLNTSFLLSHMAQCLCLAVTRLTANPPTHS